MRSKQYIVKLSLFLTYLPTSQKLTAMIPITLLIFYLLLLHQTHRQQRKASQSMHLILFMVGRSKHLIKRKNSHFFLFSTVASSCLQREVE